MVVNIRDINLGVRERDGVNIHINREVVMRVNGRMI